MAKNKPVPTEEPASPPPGVPAEGGAPAAESKAPPKFGTPKVAECGGVPRLVRELERAPAGQTRFKVGCRNYGPRKTRYMIAADEDQARAFYLEVEKLGELLARLRKNAGAKADEVEQPELVVTQLAD